MEIVICFLQAIPTAAVAQELPDSTDCLSQWPSEELNASRWWWQSDVGGGLLPTAATQQICGSLIQRYFIRRPIVDVFQRP